MASQGPRLPPLTVTPESHRRQDPWARVSAEGPGGLGSGAGLEGPVGHLQINSRVRCPQGKKLGQQSHQSGKLGPKPLRRRCPYMPKMKCADVQSLALLCDLRQVTQPFWASPMKWEREQCLLHKTLVRLKSPFTKCFETTVLGTQQVLNEGLLFLVWMMMSFHCIEAFSNLTPVAWLLPGEPGFCWVLYLGQGFTCPPAREKLPIAGVSSEGPEGAPCASPLCRPGVGGAERRRGQADGVQDSPSLSESGSRGKLFGRPRGILQHPPAQPGLEEQPTALQCGRHTNSLLAPLVCGQCRDRQDSCPWVTEGLGPWARRRICPPLTSPQGQALPGWVCTREGSACGVRQSVS